MVNWKLIRCGLNLHQYGKMLHDDLFKRWIKICKNCGNIIVVAAPKDENGDPMDPHEWLRMENVRSFEELDEAMERLEKWLEKIKF